MGGSIIKCLILEWAPKSYWSGLQRVKRDVSVLGTGFGCICDWYLRLNCPKHGHGRARYRLDSVCCLSVCLFVILFNFLQAAFWTSSSKNSIAISWKSKWILHKNHPKSGLKKVGQNEDRQTDKQTGLGRSWAAPRSCFGQLKRRYQSQKPQKPVPKTTSESR